MPYALAVVHEENGDFGVSFPDFPGCISGGRSVEEVLRKGSEALCFHIAGMVEDGDALPSIRTAAQIRIADPDFAEGGELAYVAYELPTRSLRVNISIDENLLKAIDAAAQADGTTRSAYLASAARQKIRSDDEKAA